MSDLADMREDWRKEERVPPLGDSEQIRYPSLFVSRTAIDLVRSVQPSIEQQEYHRRKIK